MWALGSPFTLRKVCHICQSRPTWQICQSQVCQIWHTTGKNGRNGARKRAPFLIFGEIPCTHGLVVTQGAPDGLVRQKTQQSIHQSTHFFSTTKCFGRNAPFLAHLRNLLTTSNLQTSHNFRNSVFHFKHCERCLTEVQNMPNRNSKDGRPSPNTCQTPTRKMPFRNFFTHFLVFHLAKTAFSFSISRKILTQLFNHFPWQRASPWPTL